MQKFFALALLTLLLAGCTTLAKEPVAVSHSYVTPEKDFWSTQITMHTGVPSTPQQTVMIVYSKFSKTPIITVSGQTKTMSEDLWDKVFNAVTTFGAAGINGSFVLKAAEAGCPPGTICGTLVQVQNSAGAQAAADSSTSQTTNN